MSETPRDPGNYDTPKPQAEQVSAEQAPLSPSAAPDSPAAPPQYAQPQYAQPQYAPPQYPQPYPQQPYPQPQYGQQQYAQQQYPQYAPPQYPQQQQQQAYGPQAQYRPVPPPGPGEPFDGAQHAGELRRPLYGANMGQAFSRFFRNYANFSGRASRSEYWWMQLVFVCAYLAAVLIALIFAAAIESADPYGTGGADIVMGFFGVLVFFTILGLIIPSLALTWRRLHDSNLAGPLFFLSFIPYAGSLVVFIFTLLSPRPEGRRFDPPAR